MGDKLSSHTRSVLKFSIYTVLPYLSQFAYNSSNHLIFPKITFTHGLIAGGMNDGHVHLWDPSKLTDGGPVEIIASVEQHQGK
jgi:hypothetical protein